MLSASPPCAHVLPFTQCAVDSGSSMLGVCQSFADVLLLLNLRSTPDREEKKRITIGLSYLFVHVVPMGRYEYLCSCVPSTVRY